MIPPPLIDEAAWGVIVVAGFGRFKDAKVWPGGAKEWDWSETGTHHSPGIQPADVAELVDAGASVVVLGTGMHGALGVTTATLAHLAAHGVGVEVHRTPAAVDVYNRLCADGAVGGLFHSTC